MSRTMIFSIRGITREIVKGESDRCMHKIRARFEWRTFFSHLQGLWFTMVPETVWPLSSFTLTTYPAAATRIFPDLVGGVRCTILQIAAKG
jgi:hypothetical protein